jgi:hypothetical protein
MTAKPCVALEWMKAEDGQKDYVPCDETNATPCRLVGLLLAVDADLCEAHQKYFAKNPKGWGLAKVFDVETGSRIDFDYRGQRYLTAEKEVTA